MAEGHATVWAPAEKWGGQQQQKIKAAPEQAVSFSSLLALTSGVRPRVSTYSGNSLKKEKKLIGPCCTP